jgi:hypothetical protein
MKLVRAFLVVLSAALVLAKSVTAHAGCTDNSFFPLAVGTTRTYQAPNGTQNTLVVLTVDNTTGVVTERGTLSTSSIPATVTITCVPNQGILFDLAQAVSGPISATITSPSGVTIPLPDQFKLYGSSGTGVGQWTHAFSTVTKNGSVAITMNTTETHTVVAVPPTETATVPGYSTPRGAFKIQVVAVSTFGGVTGLPNGMHFPPVPSTTKTIFEWIVEKVGLVKYGPANGPFTQLVSCGTTCP